MSTVKLVSLSAGHEGATAEQLIAHCARVSNPDNQFNHDTAPKLLRYLIRNKHWSPFEMASMCVEITTTRAISAQIIRHRSFSYQEFSQRYAPTGMPDVPELRYRAETDRQSSLQPLLQDDPAYNIAQQALWYAHKAYENLLQAGVAKECARAVLPMCSPTRLYMHGTVRSWVHYLQVRTDPHAQKEHRDIAVAIKAIFVQQFPATAEALLWMK